MWALNMFSRCCPASLKLASRPGGNWPYSHPQKACAVHDTQLSNLCASNELMLRAHKSHSKSQASAQISDLEKLHAVAAPVKHIHALASAVHGYMTLTACKGITGAGSGPSP